MSKPTNNAKRNLLGGQVAGLLFGAVLAVTSPTLQAAPVLEVTGGINTFQADAFPGLTDGLQLTVDQAGATPIGSGIEYPGFGLGTYDVDVSANGLTMTLIADPNALGVASYNDQTFDRYYFSFDRAIASASLDVTASNMGFAAIVDVLAPGTSIDFDGILQFPGVDPTLPTALSLANGGLLITIASGTNLIDVGQGGQLSVAFTAVPEPEALPVLAMALLAFGIARLRRRGQS